MNSIKFQLHQPQISQSVFFPLFSFSFCFFVCLFAFHPSSGMYHHTSGRRGLAHMFPSENRVTRSNKSKPVPDITEPPTLRKLFNPSALPSLYRLASFMYDSPQLSDIESMNTLRIEMRLIRAREVMRELYKVTAYLPEVAFKKISSEHHTMFIPKEPKSEGNNTTMGEKKSGIAAAASSSSSSSSSFPRLH